jgi:two-component system CheB/CheR fusion protein
MRSSARTRRPLPRKKARRPEGAQKALQARLREAEQTIDAIRSGQVDALVLRSPDGETVYALETADRPYRVLVEQMAQGAATLDAAGLIVYSNPRLHRLMGVASDALVGTPFASLFSEQLRGGVERLVAQARTAPCTLETRLRLEGRLAPVQVSASPLGLEHMAIVALVTDLSDEKEKAALIEAREALQRADRQKDEFLATLAHELRNPLAPIRNTVSLLQSRLKPGSEELPGVEVIARQVEHMALLLDDLLDVSQLTRGAMALRKEPVLLQRVLDLAIETSSPVISAAGHELAVALPERPLVLEADVLRLSQAIANVLNNAAKYTDRGGRIALDAESDEGFVRVRIRDTGIGISPEALDTIFDLFSQATPALERSQGGLGIGLSLVRGLVELHGGTIEARSRGLGKGSEFVIRLPLAPAGHAESLPARERTARAGALSLRILVADDNQDSAESLALLLQMMGHEVRTELDGAQAVETARAFQPQVVLLDLGMPRLNGYEAARRIRALPGGDDVVLIAQTGWSQPEDRRRSQEAGFDHHVVKPIPSGSLEKLLAPRRPGAVPPSH